VIKQRNGLTFWLKSADRFNLDWEVKEFTYLCKKCRLFYRCSDSSGKRKVRATQSISLPNRKRFRNEYLNYGKCHRKYTADGF
jgi:hypothetical protein